MRCTLQRLDFPSKPPSALGELGRRITLSKLVPQSLNATRQPTQEMGWLFAALLFLRAYSLGGGTYTGIEAVSNYVPSLAKPRVATGKWTMSYMAVSLSFTAGGITLRYRLWNVQAVEGQTVDAVTFRAIIESSGWHAPRLENRLLRIVRSSASPLHSSLANLNLAGSFHHPGSP